MVRPAARIYLGADVPYPREAPPAHGVAAAISPAVNPAAHPGIQLTPVVRSFAPGMGPGVENWPEILVICFMTLNGKMVPLLVSREGRPYILRARAERMTALKKDDGVRKGWLS